MYFPSFFSPSVCPKYVKKWVVMNPEHLDQVTEFSQYFLVGVSECVTLDKSDQSHCAIERSSTLLYLAPQGHQSAARDLLGSAFVCTV